MRLFNLEAHISVIADIENIFTRLYPDIEITSWNLSGHNFVFDRTPTDVEVVNQSSWKQIDQRMIDQFHARYDGFLQQFDGFICGFPPIFALLFEKYNKPVFMVNATRYEMPFCWEPNPVMQQTLETTLLRMQQRGQLIAVSNNKADVDYLERATGVTSEHIPSLCLYTQHKYQPKNDKFVFYHRLGDNITKPSNTIHSKQLGKYTWQELYSHKGIVHIPYEVSTMSIFEQYSANIPLFMPSKKFLKRLLISKKIPFNGPYTKRDFPTHLEPMLGDKWVEYWVDKADFYDQQNMPFITYFDSALQIEELTKSSNTAMISSRMKAWNKTRQKNVLAQWQSLIEPHYKAARYKPVIGQGQINMKSEFGQEIFKLACNTNFKNFLEIGTWNGEGSTVCLMNGLMPRDDDSVLYSIELMQPMFTQATLFWSWLKQSKYAHQLVLLNGKITNDGLMSRDEIEAHSAFNKIKQHYELYYQSDKSNFNSAINIADQLPSTIDVAVLDGGEFCSTAEFTYVLEHLSPKVFVLDDTSIIKCAAARKTLLESDEWVSLYDKPAVRHGASIFIRKDQQHLIH